MTQEVFVDNFRISRLGMVKVAVSEKGVVAVWLKPPRSAVEDLARRGFTVVPGHLTGAVRRAFGSGRFESLSSDLTGLRPFAHNVLSATMHIPRGSVTTYGEISRRIGQPRAARAVGQALARNPVPLVIPCHRVIATGGRLGGFSGGLSIKRKLLAREGVRFF